MSGPLNLPVAMLAPLEWGYRLGAAWKHRRWDRGAGVERLACPVISVGNLTAGGTGKTPMVEEVARRLLRFGSRPVIALRGYRADRDGKSDEAELHRAALPEVSVVVGGNRAAALRERGIPLRPPTVVVLDDGFQHRRLARDLDLVLIDASRPSLRDRLLPAGWLREPASALRRADAVIVTRAAAADPELAAAIEDLHGNPPIAWVDESWSRLRVWTAEGMREDPPEWLAGRRVATLLGVGNPAAYRRRLLAHGCEEALAIPARDHQHYPPARLAEIERVCLSRGIDLVATTAKDWVKLGHAWPASLTAIVPQLELQFRAGEADFEARLRAAAGFRG